MAARKPVPMGAEVLEALTGAGVMRDYEARPWYQRNDHLGWIEGAKRPETRGKRIAQMIEELEIGGVYMGMDHRPSRRA